MSNVAQKSEGIIALNTIEIANHSEVRVISNSLNLVTLLNSVYSLH